MAGVPIWIGLEESLADVVLGQDGSLQQAVGQLSPDAGDGWYVGRDGIIVVLDPPSDAPA